MAKARGSNPLPPIFVIVLYLLGAACGGWFLAELAISFGGKTPEKMLKAAAYSFAMSAAGGVIGSWRWVWWPPGMIIGFVLRCFFEAIYPRGMEAGFMAGLLAIMLFVPVLCASFIGAATGARGRSQLSRTPK